MVTLLVGHRGVGKSTLLGAIDGGLDLDAEIERETGESIANLLARSEREFRALEARVLAGLVARGPGVIAVGAGFEGPLPAGVDVVWVRRVTDPAGRVFLNRPRLNASVSPFDEYMERFTVREARYRAWANRILTLPEGGPPLWPPPAAPFDLTLFDERVPPGFRRYELRDDLLSRAQIEAVLGKTGDVLFANRTGREAPEGVMRDWALELGPPPGAVAVLSRHGPGEFPANFGGIRKYAPEVRTFTELRAGHRWWLEDPARRAFLPRSANGRWRWYRSLFGPSMPIHFVREGDGSGLDQPFTWQSCLQKPFTGRFAAVLGAPVEHSRSPMEHRGLDMPFVSIEVREPEFADAWRILRELGLVFAAVTAPLKKVAVSVCRDLTPLARELGAVNTIAGDFGHNTDALALEALAREVGACARPVLWGGGGVKSSVRRAWPYVREVSARSGTGEGDPDLVVWAVGRGREFRFPPDSWRPRLVLDLNYGDDSPGLEWAARRNLPYQSGLRMFKLQAEFQRDFWKDHA